MTREEKDFLFKDFCARLPYGVAIECRDEDSRFTCYLTTDILREIQNNTCYWEYKPYLFPLSSMTEEQYDEWTNMGYSVTERWWSMANYHQIDWFNKNHLDYRGLIEKGLAIDCTNLNIY